LLSNTNSPEPAIDRRITNTSYMVNYIPNSSISLSPSSTISQTMPNKRPRHTLHQYSPRELGKWAVHQQRLLARLGWQCFFFHHQRPHLVHPSIKLINHPTAQYLHDMACTGAPAILSTPPWPCTTLDQVYQRGPHTSAAHQFAKFLIKDMYDYIQMEYWLVLPFSAVCNQPNLCLAPSGVVPQ